MPGPGFTISTGISITVQDPKSTLGAHLVADDGTFASEAATQGNPAEFLLNANSNAVAWSDNFLTATDADENQEKYNALKIFAFNRDLYVQCAILDEDGKVVSGDKVIEYIVSPGEWHQIAFSDEVIGAVYVQPVTVASTPSVTDNGVFLHSAAGTRTAVQLDNGETELVGKIELLNQ